MFSTCCLISPNNLVVFLLVSFINFKILLIVANWFSTLSSAFHEIFTPMLTETVSLSLALMKYKQDDKKQIHKWINQWIIEWIN